MSVLQFFRIRLIRLHPLVLIGATLGLLGYLFDPFSKAINHTDAAMLLLAYVTSLLLLPSPPVGGRHNESQALNGPAWSLMQEYLGNIAYALILRRLRALTLAIIFGLSGLLLIWTANAKGSLDGGWDYPKIWMAPLRLTVSFVMGLWLYRVHDRIRIPKIGLLLLSIVLVVCFQMPVFPKIGEYSLNGLYDAACVLFLFPLIILCGAHSDAGTGMIRLCKFSGHLSYPLYITHIPFVYVLAGYSWTRHPSLNVKLTLIFLLIPFVIFVAWLVLKYLRRACPLLAEPALRDQAGDSEGSRTGRRSTMMSILKRLVRSAGPLLTLGLVFATPLLAQEQAAFVWHGLSAR